MKDTLNYLMAGNHLTESMAYKAMKGIAGGAYNTEHITAFIAHYWYYKVTTEELTGFRKALLELAVPVKLTSNEAIDLCGTGGDGKNTFNISTLTAVVVAGAGYKVIKHGNYGVTSISGSSNVLEQLGYSFSTDTTQLNQELDGCNLTFLHAPLFHPALKQVGGIRKQLGIKTFFNMLGPMVNPATPAYQLVGVYDLQVARQYQYLLQQTSTRFTIVHSLDGYDEITLTGNTRVISPQFDGILSPTELMATKIHTAAELRGGNTLEEAAEIFKQILMGKGSIAQNEVVLSNAAMAIKTIDNTKSIAECYQEAKESLVSGIALSNFTTLLHG